MPKRYSNPTSTGPGRYAPAQGLRLSGDFYLGGERVPLSALRGLSSEQLAEVGHLLHDDQGRALVDYVRSPSPPKGTPPRSFGSTTRPWDDPVAEVQGVSGLGSNELPDTIVGGRQRAGSAGPYLSDEEALYNSPTQVQKLVDVFNAAPGSQVWAVGAKMGRAKRGWYKKATTALITMFGGEAPRFAALLAATSPQKSVMVNLQVALHLWADYQAEVGKKGRELTPKEMQGWLNGPIRQRLSDLGLSHMRGEQKNVIRALDTGVSHGSSGAKVGSFGGNLMGDLARVTNDTYQALFGRVNQGDLEGVRVSDWFGSREIPAGAYAGLSAKQRKAAELLSQEDPTDPWEPAEVQETTWSTTRGLANEMGAPRLRAGRDVRNNLISPRQAAQRSPDPRQALGSLTHEQVANNADFVPLLLGPELSDTRRMLSNRLGMGQNLDQTRRGYDQEMARHPAPTGPVTQGLTTQELQIAEEIARQAGVGTGKFMNPHAQYQKAPISAPGRVRRRYASQAQPDSLVASSSNTEADLTFDEAFKRVRSGDQKVFQQVTDRIADQLGVKGRSQSGIGDWEDGAEHSLLTHLSPDVDSDTLKYIGAWYGLTGNQRAVLIFRPEERGLDSVYTIKVPETDALKVRAALSKHGVPYRTIVPGRDGTEVVVYDQKRQLRDNVSQFAQAYHAPIRESIGSGEYLGAQSRAAARKVYRDTIANFEAKRGRRSTLSAEQAPEPGRGRGTPPQEAA